MTTTFTASEKSLVKFLLKWLGVVTLSLLMCELSLRVWGFSPLFTITIKGLPEESANLRFTLDPVRLYRMKPWKEAHINSWGFRDTEFTTRQAHIPRVIVVGDSFPMGLAVAPEETFPKLLATHLPAGAEVFNLGIQGYGPDQELEVIADEVLRLAPDCVVWSVFPGNDFADVVKNRLYEHRTDGVLQKTNKNWVTENVPTLKLTLAMNIFRFGSFLPPAVQAQLDAAFFQDKVHILVDDHDHWRSVGVPLATSLYKQGRDLLVSHGIRVVAVVIPSFEVIQDDTRIKSEGVPIEAYFTNEELAVKALTEAGVPFVDLTSPFRAHQGDPLYVASDRHLSPLGHKKAAELIAPLVR